MKKYGFTLLGIVLLASNTMADSSTGMGVSAKAGTLGLGIEAIKPISNNFDLRIGLNKFDYDANETLDSVDYQAKLNMKTVAALADWHPAGNGFIASSGVMFNDNRLNASATVTVADPITIGTSTITSGVVKSGISFEDMSPYLGIGYRQPFAGTKGWLLSADAGVLFQGKPKVTLTESTGTVSQSNIDTEIASIKHDVDALKQIPVVSLGIAYKF